MSPLQARASAFVDCNILPTIQAALETYPLDDVPDVLERCRVALARDLAQELKDVGRQLIDQTFERSRR
jgi:hypothetical protein